MKKYFAALLVFLFVLSPVNGYAAASFTLQLSAKEVLRGGEITLSGTAAGSGSEVIIKIVSPNDTVFYLDVITPADGNYSATVAIPADEELAPLGMYTAVAGIGKEMKSAAFSVAGTIGEGTGGGGVVVPPAEEGNIPSGAGEANGSGVQPEQDRDGRYMVGSDTLAEAMRQGDGSVTINLPAAAFEAGKALELPAESVTELRNQKQDLVLKSENLTVHLPAGFMDAPAGEQARIRLILHTAWTNEAQQTVEQSIRPNSGYSPTEVVLSAVIEVVSGDDITGIHKLNKPVTVMMKLTEEQERAFRSELAGVYYVNGEEARYVGGSIQDGTLTFHTDHFSYYTILEYDKSFADLTGHWAENPVKRLAAKHIVTGVDERHYEPGRSIVRAEFVSLIMRAIEQSGAALEEPGSNPFADVAAGQYYTGHAAAAAQAGIITGYGGKFRPNDKMTREEAAAVLVRAAAYMNVPAAEQKELSFQDEEGISAWAVPSVNEARSLGLIQGDGNNRFNPKHPVTRAEAAVMIDRLLTDSSS